MTKEQILAAIQTASPTKPQFVRLTSGAVLPVPHSDYLLFLPAMPVAVWSNNEGRLEILGVDQIVSVGLQQEVQPQAKAAS